MVNSKAQVVLNNRHSKTIYTWLPSGAQSAALTGEPPQTCSFRPPLPGARPLRAEFGLCFLVRGEGGWKLASTRQIFSFHQAGALTEAEIMNSLGSGPAMGPLAPKCVGLGQEAGKMKGAAETLPLTRPARISVDNLRAPARLPSGPRSPVHS